MDFIWKAIALVGLGSVLLRIAGRKSISQMTISQTIVMISIGSLIVQPVAEKYVWKAISIGGIFVFFLMLMEWIQIKFNVLENLLTGKGIVVIDHGEILVDNLKKIRLTVDQLEMRLRQKGISNIQDIKTATIESNGEVGYEFMRHAKPVTIGDLEKIMGRTIPDNTSALEMFNLFDEVKNNKRKAITSEQKLR